MINTPTNANFSLSIIHRLSLVICGFFLVLISVSHTLAAMPIDDGLSAYNRRDFVNAWTILKPLADRGDVEAQRRIAVMFRHGLGVAKNDKMAIEWYRKAAMGGHPRAQNSLGIMYRFGLGVKKNPVEGARWLLAAAEQGDAKGQENIGLVYLDGDGIPQSDELATQWLTKAANQGQSKAQTTLGLMLLEGRGSDKNEESALKWLRKAAYNGSKRAAAELAKAYSQGIYGIKKNKQKAEFWYRRAGLLLP